ncbi:hypothetical protein MferCBS31731_004482 [Microsporum ferrugineum]
MWQEAHSLYLRSLFGRLNTLDEEHEDTLITFQGLGAVKAILKDASQARPLLERAYIGFENLKTPPKDKTITLLTLNSLATVYFELGMFHDAEVLFEQGIPRMRRDLGLRDKRTCIAIYNFLHFTKLDDAEDTFKLMALMASSNNTPAYQVCQSLSAGFLRDIRDTMQEVARERDSWGLNNPLECQCGKKTTRMCQVIYIDEQPAAQNTLVQQNANWQRTTYTPTVSPAQTPTVKIISERVEIFEKMTLEQFASDPTFTRKPKLVSSSLYFFSESEFPTIRIWIDPSKPIEARELRILPILDGNRDKYLTVAMGSEPMASLTKRYTKDTGIYRSPDMQFPDQDLSDYLQMTRTRTFGLSPGFVMVIWER